MEFTDDPFRVDEHEHIHDSPFVANDLIRGRCDVAPYNAAADAFQTKATKLSPKATSIDYANLAEPLAHASETLTQALLRLPWPAAMKPDVNALVTADTIFEGDLLGIRDQSLFSATAFFQQFVNDAAKTKAAVSIVRADLGLPPAKS